MTMEDREAMVNVHSDWLLSKVDTDNAADREARYCGRHILASARLEKIPQKFLVLVTEAWWKRHGGSSRASGKAQSAILK